MSTYKPEGKSPGPRPDGRRGSGSNKTRRKQREYKAHVHAQIKAGLENDANGTWKPARTRG